MSVTPEIEAEIIRAYNVNPSRFSPFKVAKAVGATISEVLATVRSFEASPMTFDGSVKRPELMPYIVASRRAQDAGWNNDDIGVVTARARFCAGTHDMATHREGPWLHLCSLPLSRQRKPRPNYFEPGAH